MSTPNPADLVVVRTARDNLTGDPGTPVEHSVPAVIWAPTGTEEQSARSQTGGQVVTRRDLYDASGFAWQASDRVRFPGETGAPWSVIGDSAQWTAPWETTSPDQVIQLERTTG